VLYFDSKHTFSSCILMPHNSYHTGAVAFKSYSLGRHFFPEKDFVGTNHTYDEALALVGDTMTIHPQGYATDKKFNNIHLLPEDLEVDLSEQAATWKRNGKPVSLRILPGHDYVHPSGYKIRLEKHPASTAYKLIGTAAEGTYCHKPSTVSGGGKSEISKSLDDAVIYGNVYIGDFESDMQLVKDIIERDYSNCFQPQFAELQARSPSRKILSLERSLGSVVKLLTPKNEYTTEHNAFISGIPSNIRSVVFAIKRFYKPEWNDDWLCHFSVDIVNGEASHDLKLDDRKLAGSYLRVGHDHVNGGWRTFKLRQDFISSSKVQMEDDISASIVVPRSQIPCLPEEYTFPSLKITQNCEWRLFQRPDDAIYPGYDKQTEQGMYSFDGIQLVYMLSQFSSYFSHINFHKDLGGEQVFVSNFKPIYEEEMKDLTERVDFYELFSHPMKNHMMRSLKEGRVNMCSAKPRIWHGQQTKNPRYLQVRPDVARPRDKYLAQLGSKFINTNPIPCSV